MERCIPKGRIGTTGYDSKQFEEVAGDYNVINEESVMSVKINTSV